MDSEPRSACAGVKNKRRTYRNYSKYPSDRPKLSFSAETRPRLETIRRLLIDTRASSRSQRFPSFFFRFLKTRHPRYTHTWNRRVSQAPPKHRLNSEAVAANSALMWANTRHPGRRHGRHKVVENSRFQIDSCWRRNRLGSNPLRCFSISIL
jgi:hypothetical protein